MAVKAIGKASSNEEEIIKYAYDILSKFKNKRGPITLSGFNINNFDIKFLINRMIKYDIPSREELHIFGNKFKYVDTRTMLDPYYRAKGTLSDYLEYFGVGEKTNGIDGSKIQELVEQRQWEDIEKYVINDAKQEHFLLLRVMKYYKVKTRLKNIITFDLETACDKDKIPNEIKAKELYKEKIDKEYKRFLEQNKFLKKTNIHPKEYFYKKFNYAEFKKEHIKKAGVDKFKGQIVAVGFAAST